MRCARIFLLVVLAHGMEFDVGRAACGCGRRRDLGLRSLEAFLAARFGMRRLALRLLLARFARWRLGAALLDHLGLGRLSGFFRRARRLGTRRFARRALASFATAPAAPATAAATFFAVLRDGSRTG